MKRKRKRKSEKPGASRLGFSAVEIIMCIVILALALIPIVGSVTQGQKKAILTEHHIIARMRANMIVEMLISRGYVTNKLEADKGGGELKSPFTVDDADKLFFEVAPELKQPMKTYTDTITFEEFTPSGSGSTKPGLALIAVKTEWTLSDGIKAGGKAGAHSVTVERFIVNMKQSLNDEAELKQGSS